MFLFTSIAKKRRLRFFVLALLHNHYLSHSFHFDLVKLRTGTLRFRFLLLKLRKNLLISLRYWKFLLAKPSFVFCFNIDDHRVHIFTTDETGLVYVSAHSAGAYTATLLVMVNVVKEGGRAPPPSPASANFTLMIECTPESDCFYSVYSVLMTLPKYCHSWHRSLNCSWTCTPVLWCLLSTLCVAPWRVYTRGTWAAPGLVWTTGAGAAPGGAEITGRVELQMDVSTHRGLSCLHTRAWLDPLLDLWVLIDKICITAPIFDVTYSS